MTRHTTQPPSPRARTLVLASLLLAATAPQLAAPASAGLDQTAFEELLARMQASVDASVEHYEAGEVDAALEEARFVRDQFAFNASGASELEEKIKAVSAVSIGDQVKAEAARLVNAIEQGAPAEEVARIAGDLAPSLNHLVLIAEGKTAPASQRSLRSTDAIDAAATQVLDQVAEAVERYRAGDQQAAKNAAEEAFFTFETNGLGPDTSTVDDDLENEVENLIVNFDQSTVEQEPGLSQLIERGASVEEVTSHAERIGQGIARVVELLEATLPPVDLGDANQDGRVSIVDALLTAQASLGIRSEDPAMDANQDGRVTIVDALLIAQAALGIRTL